MKFRNLFTRSPVTVEPPKVAGLLASHSVPYGRIFRQWDTDGRLWVWCNRGEIADLPRGPQPNGFNSNSTEILFNEIPIYNA